MRLLLVAEDVPNRDPHSGDGGSMISHELLTRLPADVDVELVSFRGDVAVPAEVAARCLRVHLLGRRSRPAALLRSAGSLWEVGACERATDEAARLVAGLSVQHDVTLLHGPHVAFLAASLSRPAVLQVVDPWSIRTRMESVMAGPVRRRFLGMQARRLEKAERSLPEQVTLLTVGLADAVSWSEVLGRPVTAVSNGVTVASPVPRATVPTVCFAGSLDYPPHVDSARRLVLAVAPLVWEVLPQARFVLAGRRPTADVLELAGDRVEVRADVPSLPQELARAHVAAFADRFGVGVRNTVREDLAAGVRSWRPPSLPAGSPLSASSMALTAALAKASSMASSWQGPTSRWPMRSCGSSPAASTTPPPEGAVLPGTRWSGPTSGCSPRRRGCRRLAPADAVRSGGAFLEGARHGERLRAVARPRRHPGADPRAGAAAV